MKPQGGTLQNTPVQEQEQPTCTWLVDWDKKRIVGMTDGLDALKQAVFCILQTERFEYLIYSFNYGHELKTLIGRSPSYVESEINRMITEALTQDDRIEGISNLKIEVNGDNLLAQFDVITTAGRFEQEVDINVLGPNV